jgi:hypothetical protein
MIEKEINETLKSALKGGEKVKVSVLRMVMSEIGNKKIADRVKELDDEKVIDLIQKMARRHKESIEQFREGGREDLVMKETEELAVLDAYLPEQLSEEEVTRIISESIEHTGATSLKDMGKVMNDCMSRIKGGADGKLISRIVKEKLS